MWDNIVLSLSVLTQLIAAVLAWRMKWLTGKSLAWIILSCALTMQAFRRALVLIQLNQNPALTIPSWDLMLGFYISVFMLIAMILIKSFLVSHYQLHNTLERTERQLRATTATLQVSEQHYRALFTELTSAFIVVEVMRGEQDKILDFKFLEINSAFDQVTGLNRADFLGKTCSEVSLEDSLQWSARCHQIAEHGKPQHFHIFSERLQKHLGVVAYLASKQQIAFLINDITERLNLAQQQEKMVEELREALGKVKQLSGLIPICAHCKKIRDDHGYWQQLEGYITSHSEALFSHGLCPQCIQDLYPEIDQNRDKS